jgi:16S rRNA C1402 N4-methylase RsmH
VVAFDRDKIAIQNAEIRFPAEIASGRLTLVHSPFGSIQPELSKLGLAGKVNGILAETEGFPS